MKKVVLVCCFFVLMFSGVANAAISSDWYGTYTGWITIGSKTYYNMTITIGDDKSSLSLDEDDYYVWAPTDTDSWSSNWTDSDSDVNFFQADSSSSTMMHYTSAGSSWMTGLTLILSGDTITVTGLSGEVDEDDPSGTWTYSPASGTFTRATPIPGAAWLLGTGLVGLVGLQRRRKIAGL